MKCLFRLGLVMALASAVVFVAFAQQELTKQEWTKQIAETRAQRDNLKSTLDSLVKVVSDLQKQDADKGQALKQCQDELSALQGQYEAPFLAKLDKIDARLKELSGLSNQDLWARRAELDSVQKWINEANGDPLSVIQKYQDRIKDQQSRLDALKKTLEQIIASGQAGSTYTVGTWSRDRDCLWNIAKKPKIYANPFLWPKIWQGNRDQIKNPDVIHPGQRLKIPPKADLTREERSALRKYWARKSAKPAPSNP